MGISDRLTKTLAEFLKDKGITGKVLTYGVQGVEGQYADLIKILKDKEYAYKKLPENEIILDDKTQFGNSIHQDVLFKSLGFEKVESLDYYSNEEAKHVLDLNQLIPENLHNEYDMVFDGGTLEHCFDVKTVLTNTVKFLKIGGYVIHANPISGWINHGFYQFSPTLYYDFYSINGFIDLEMKILIDDNYYIDYRGQRLPYDFLGDRAILIFIAKKDKEMEEILNPIQSEYVQKFGNGSNIAKNNIKTKFNFNYLKKIFLFKNILKNIKMLLRYFVALNKIQNI